MYDSSELFVFNENSLKELNSGGSEKLKDKEVGSMRYILRVPKIMLRKELSSSQLRSLQNRLVN
jgi:hypothetical protein